jgi:hypothetical protein
MMSEKAQKGSRMFEETQEGLECPRRHEKNLEHEKHLECSRASSPARYR